MNFALLLKKLGKRRKLYLVASILVIACVVGFLALTDTKPFVSPPLPLVQKFQSAPGTWLKSTKGFDDLRGAMSSGNVAEIAVAAGLGDAPVLMVTTRQGAHFAVTSVLGAAALDDWLVAQSEKHPFALVRVTVSNNSPLDKFLEWIGLGGVVLLKLTAAIVPVVLLVVVAKMMGAGSKTGLLTERPDTSLDDVIGADEAKSAMREVVSFMRDPERFSAIGAKAPRGVLLVGPPGTGKTLLARALAGQCKANFINVDGSHFTSMFYEQGVKRVKALFEEARKNAPCVIFIDEVDGLGKRSTSNNQSSGDKEENRIIGRILVEMDGFSPSENVVVVAATNHEENIDSALRRPGRFDIRAVLTLPNQRERQDLFRLCLSRVQASADLDLVELAEVTSEMSPAAIELAVNRAAVFAVERGSAEVAQEDLHASIETQQLGGKASSIKELMSSADRERIAVHEAGHALVGYLAHAGKVGKITIEPRGQALGVTHFSREDESPLYGEHELKGRLAMLLAGREAELMIFGNTSSGASNDLERATNLAVKMVCELGFSERFGVMSFAGIPETLLSPATKESALEEARTLLTEAGERCHKLLTGNRSVLERLVKELLQHETVSGSVLVGMLPPKSACGHLAAAA